MAIGIAITRQVESAAELCCVARQSLDGAQARRLSYLMSANVPSKPS